MSDFLVATLYLRATTSTQINSMLLGTDFNMSDNLQT